MGKKRVIIDCDPGVDDAMALVLAFGSDEITIDAITTTYGNNDNVELCARNTCILLQFCKRKDIPVYVGSRGSLDHIEKDGGGIGIHGKEGIGDVKVEDLPFKVDLSPIQEELASSFIVKHCKAHKGEVTIIALGPLTNMSVATFMDPNLPKNCKELLVMGGSMTDKGNSTPVAEANFFNDPHSAKHVFRSYFNMVVFPLNVTHKILSNEDFRKTIREAGKLGKFIDDINKNYVDFYLKRNGFVPCHDSTPVMYCVDPSIFSDLKELYVDIETKGELTNGMCVVDWRNHYNKKPNCRVCFDADNSKFLQVYLDRFLKLSKEIEK